MVSFDVKSLFTSVRITETIDIILDHIYNRKEMSTVLTKDKMKKFLTLSTKNVHFTLNNKIYVQNGGVVMGSHLGPILANVFIVESSINCGGLVHFPNPNVKLKLYLKNFL